MPLEIRELHIKVNIDPSPAGASGNVQQNTTGGNNAINSKEDVVSACVEEVMSVIKNKKER